MIKDTEKTKVHEVVFVLVFTGETVLKKSEAPEMRGKLWRKEDLFLVEEDQVRNI